MCEEAKKHMRDVMRSTKSRETILHGSPLLGTELFFFLLLSFRTNSWTAQPFLFFRYGMIWPAGMEIAAERLLDAPCGGRCVSSLLLFAFAVAWSISH